MDLLWVAVAVGCLMVGVVLGRRSAEADLDRKVLYSVAEVAAITGCRPGRILRWIHRRQLDAVHLEGSPLVPLTALLVRLERIEAARVRRRALRDGRARERRLRLEAGDGPAEA